MQSSLNRQTSDLDKLTSDAQRSMDEMRRLLDAEGLTGTPETEAPKAENAEKKPKAKGHGGAAAGPRAVVPRGEGSDGQNGHWARRIFGQPVHRISPPERDGARKRQARGGRRDLRKEGTGRHSALAASAAALCKEGVLKNGEVTNIDLFPLPERRRR